MIKPKGNLLAWLRRRRPKVVLIPQFQTMETPMPKNLAEYIARLIEAYTAAKAKIAALESTNRSLLQQVKTMEDAEADMASKIDSVLDVGGSMGGVTG